ncbi:MAG TPA: DUF5678 domain-containing protein [Dehalococcoidia bacterium]|nr:DUF5678 domain-containing protein [Dehalococcoidia bacterium]
MSTFDEERARDFAAYEQLKAALTEKYQGLYVAIANGRLIKVAPTIEEAREAVKQYRHRLVFQAGAEPVRGTVYIRWLTP